MIALTHAATRDTLWMHLPQSCAINDVPMSRSTREVRAVCCNSHASHSATASGRQWWQSIVERALLSCTAES